MPTLQHVAWEPVGPEGEMAGVEAVYGEWRPAERRYGQAREDFEKVIEVRPNYAGAFVNRGNVHYRQGFYVRAVQDYATALKIWITPW